MNNRGVEIRRSAILIGALACVACQEDAAKPGDGDPGPQPTNSYSGALVISASDFGPGRTAVPLDGRASFALWRTSGDPVANAGMLAAHARIVKESSGAEIPVVVEQVAEQSQPSQALFDYVATSTLEPDTWYALEVTPSAELQVSCSGSEMGEVCSEPFFTGSAPHVVSVELIDKSQQVLVGFSEPIQLAGLDAAEVVAVESVHTTCMYQQGDCVPSWGADGAVARRMVFQFPDVFPDDPSVSIVLPAATLGVARSVAEGVLAAGTVWTAAGATDMQLTVPAGNWISCQQGVAKCWWYERGVK